jgi:murein DD-endopeptidase MepM/ murein hydrolase activator NlpD
MMILTIAAGLAASSMIGAANVGSAAGPPVRAQILAVALPSGSADEFRKHLIDWSAPPPATPIKVAEPFAGRNPEPSPGLRISSGFGLRSDPFRGISKRHEGVDLPGFAGSRVMATAAGVVRVAARVPGYGNFVEIEHGNGIRTRYGHLARIRVAAGENVRARQVIGDLGSTGRSTGPHLHYEVRMHGVAVNPVDFFGHSSASVGGTEGAPDETRWPAEVDVTPHWTGWDNSADASTLPGAIIR